MALNYFRLYFTLPKKLSKRIKTQTKQGKKVFQSNSGPALSKLACVYLLLFAFICAERQNRAAELTDYPPPYSSQMLTAVDRCKKLKVLTNLLECESLFSGYQDLADLQERSKPLTKESWKVES